jgi:hypothetical protein
LAAAEPRENAEHDVYYNNDRHRHYVMISVSTSRAPAGPYRRRYGLKAYSDQGPLVAAPLLDALRVAEAEPEDGVAAERAANFSFWALMNSR